MSDSLIGTTRAAQILMVSTNTVRMWVKEGRLTPYDRTAGGHMRFRRSDVDALFTANPFSRKKPAAIRQRELAAAAIAWRRTWLGRSEDGRRMSLDPGASRAAQELLLAAAERYAEVMVSESELGA